jgi:hypothetical protein
MTIKSEIGRLKRDFINLGCLYHTNGQFGSPCFNTSFTEASTSDASRWKRNLNLAEVGMQQGMSPTLAHRSSRLKSNPVSTHSERPTRMNA